MNDEHRRQRRATPSEPRIETLRRRGEARIRRIEARLDELVVATRRAHERGELTAEQLLRCRAVGLLPTPAPHELN